MLDSFKFIDIICDPVNKRTLELFNGYYNEHIENNSYSIIDDVPNFIPISNNIDFNYIEHYIKDGQLFNYFEKRDYITEADFERIRQTVCDAIPKSAKLILDVGSDGGWVANYFANKKCNFSFN